MSTNLMSNPSFETGTLEKPDNWSPVIYQIDGQLVGELHYYIGDGDAYSGDRSVGGVITEYGTRGSIFWRQTRYLAFHGIKPNTTYRLRFPVKSNGHVKVWINFRGAGNVLIDQLAFDPTPVNEDWGLTDWITFTTPPDMTWFEVIIGLVGVGWYKIDDVALFEGVPECGIDADCPQDSICQNGVCVPVPPPPPPTTLAFIVAPSITGLLTLLATMVA